jgi:hypothetical protein
MKSEKLEKFKDEKLAFHESCKNSIEIA